MSAIEILVKMPEEMFEWVNDVNKFYADYRVSDFVDIIKNGTLLPKSHGDLFDKTEILRFLKCPKYKNCDWKNCFDCNKSRCININNINDLVPLIKADKAKKENKE